MLGKLIRLLLGLALIPLAIGYSVAFYGLLVGLKQVRGPELSILLGITAYLAFHALVGSPTRIYVFGHELMHALATWISGGAVKGFQAGEKSGAVQTDRISGFIALAPYLVPIYTVLWALLFGAAKLFWDISPWITWFFLGLGFTLALHLVFTVNVLKQKQTDLEVAGPLLSLGIIYWVNLALAVAVMALVIPEIHFVRYLQEGFRQAVWVCSAVFNQLFHP